MKKNPIFLKHAGVTVRRCWDPTHQDIIRDDWFSTDENPHAREAVDGAFHIVTLPTFRGKPYSDKGRRAALRGAIEQKIGPFREEDGKSTYRHARPISLA